MTNRNETFIRRCRQYLLPAAASGYWMTLTVAMHIPIKKRTGLRLQESLPSDKSIHVILYAGLAFWLIAMLEQRAWLKDDTRPKAKLFRSVAVFLFCAINGMVEELTQPLTNRSCDFNDFLADCVGAGSALAGFYVVTRIAVAFRKLAMAN